MTSPELNLDPGSCSGNTPKVPRPWGKFLTVSKLYSLHCCHMDSVDVLGFGAVKNSAG